MGGCRPNSRRLEHDPHTDASCGSPTPTATPTTTAHTQMTPAGCWCPPPQRRGALGWRLFPGQWESLRDGRTQCRHCGSDFMTHLNMIPRLNLDNQGSYLADNQVNNMACAVLTDAGTPYIYCVGGSAAQLATATDRVFRYNPVTDISARLLLPGPVRWEPFCPVASVSSTTSSTSLADLTTLWGWSITI